MNRNQLSTKQGNASGPAVKRAKRSWKLGRRAAQAALVLLLCIGAFLSLFPLGRALTRSAFLLPALLSASAPAPLVATGDPVRVTHLTLFPNTSRTVYLDIYEPATPPPPYPGGREAIIDVPGAGDNRTVPQLVNLSESLAREGIVDVNVGTPALFAYRVEPQESAAVVQAFELMEHWPGVNPQHIGIISFSVGSLSVYEAAGDPAIRAKIAFIGILGGYADVLSLLHDVGTRSQTVNGKTERWEPIATTAYVLYQSVSYLFSPSDQKLLQEAFPLTPSFPPPLPAAKVKQLSPVGAAYYHLLEGDQPGNANRNIAALTPALKALFTRLSPLSVISQARAPIYLLHDRYDPAIPYSQDVEMAAALARLHHPYNFTTYTIFNHVQVNLNSALLQELGDAPKLLNVLTNVVLPGS
ncbi:MAG TPA: hypothetical protein VKV40_12760 [Ktedonobacteraceae bacterium]|nr:hypothetical protein [Ktedonobacteraceae bacterium]